MDFIERNLDFINNTYNKGDYNYSYNYNKKKKKRAFVSISLVMLIIALIAITFFVVRKINKKNVLLDDNKDNKDNDDNDARNYKILNVKKKDDESSSDDESLSSESSSDDEKKSPGVKDRHRSSPSPSPKIHRPKGGVRRRRMGI